MDVNEMFSLSGLITAIIVVCTFGIALATDMWIFILISMIETFAVPSISIIIIGVICYMEDKKSES